MIVLLGELTNGRYTLGRFEDLIFDSNGVEVRMSKTAGLEVMCTLLDRFGLSDKFSDLIDEIQDLIDED